MNAALLRAPAIVWSVGLNDVRIWLKRPVVIFTTLLPSIMYVLITYFISATVGQPPIALVTTSSGPATAAFISLLADSGDFRITPSDASTAATELTDMSVAAVVTVPSDFDTTWQRSRRASVTMVVNNVNDDIQGDLRRSLAEAIHTFSIQNGTATSAAVALDETDTYTAHITLAQYRILAGLVLVVVVAGVVNAGLSMSQDFERGTIQELLMAPVPQIWIVTGKIVGGWLTTMPVALFACAISFAAGVLQPAPAFWIPLIVVLFVVGLAGSAVGVAVGATLRRYQLVTSVSVTVGLYLFFLSGGISVFAFLPEVLQNIARGMPLFYAIQSLQHLVFDQAMSDFWASLGIVTALAVVGAVGALLGLRKPLQNRPGL